MKYKLKCTNLDFLNHCLISYFLANCGFSGKKTEQAEKGTFVHTLLEILVNSGKEKAILHLQNIPTGLEKYIQFFKEAIELVDIFFKSVDFQKIFTEERLSSSLNLDSNDVELIGRVDLIAKINGKICVIDYKTSSQKLGYERVFGSHQMIWYALLAYLEKKIKPEEIYIINLYGKTNCKINVMNTKLTPEDFEWVTSLIKYAISIEKRGIYIKNFNNCGFCYFKEECKYLPTVLNIKTENINELIKKIKEGGQNEDKSKTNLFADALSLSKKNG